VPALGLSNKAVFEEEKKIVVADDKKPNLAEELYKEVYFSAIDLNRELWHFLLKLIILTTEQLSMSFFK
jgi:hypothetical protein